MKTPFLNRAIAELAVKMVLPAIEFSMAGGITKGKALHITILQPNADLTPSAGDLVLKASDPAILYEYSIAEETWASLERDYRTNARSKARLALRTGMNTDVIASTMPWLFQPGEFLYGGGVITDHIPVGVSGVQWQLDHTYGAMISAACAGLSRLAFAEYLVLAKEPLSWFAPFGIEPSLLPGAKPKA